LSTTRTTLLRELALSSDDPTTPPLSAASLYRFLEKNGLTQKQLLQPADHKKFEAEFANQIWQSDMMFGPYIPRPGGGRPAIWLFSCGRSAVGSAMERSSARASGDPMPAIRWGWLLSATRREIYPQQSLVYILK